MTITLLKLKVRIFEGDDQQTSSQNRGLHSECKMEKKIQDPIKLKLPSIHKTV